MTSIMAKSAKKNSPDQIAPSGGDWKSVDINDEFLLGLSEPGFQQLEILEPGTHEFTSVAAGSGDGSHISAEGDKPPHKKQTKKKKKKAAKRDREHKGGTNAEPATKLQKSSDSLHSESHVVSNVPGTEPEQTLAASEHAQPDMSAWDDYGLDALVVSSLARLGFSSPTDIQHECLPAAILGNADVIAAAQTGSGKTLAFALPIINFLVKEALSNAEEATTSDSERASRTALRALILCPTRELALQVAKDMSAVAKTLCVRVVALVGGISPQKQARLLAYKPPIIVATPGRLWDLMQSGAAHLVDLRHLNFLVLDEADRMVAQGHYEELTHILSHIPKGRKDICSPEGHTVQSQQDSEKGIITSVGGAAGDEIQTSQQVLVGALRTYVFSATLALPEQLKAKLQRGGSGSRGSRAGATLESLMHRLTFRGKPKIADLTTDRKIADNVVEAFVSCVPEERDTMLYYLLRMHPGRTLVFLNAISGVRRVSALLKALDINVQVLHAQQQQRQRLKALSRFHGGKCTVLVATDVAARGLHIPDVDMVVQYQLPPTADTYIHRAGRTARAGAAGVCVSVVVPQESERFSHLHVALGQKAPQQFPVDAKVLRDLRARARLAKRIDELERVTAKASADFKWMQRQSAAIEVDLDDMEAPSDEQGGRGGGRSRASNAHLAKQLRRELAALLAQPLVRTSQFTTGDSAAKAAGAAAASNSVAKSMHAELAGALPQDAPSGGDASASTQLVNDASRGADGSKQPRGSKAARSKRNRPKTLAQQQEGAMQKALHAKHMKKLGKRKGRTQAPTGSDGPDRVSALQVLRGASLSVASD